MPEASNQPNQPVLKYAERHIADRTNIQSALDELKKKPEIAERLIEEFDSMVSKLNQLPDTQDAKVPNSLAVKQALKEKQLPRLSKLSSEGTFTDAKNAVRTLKTINKLMEKGESGEDGWQFHQDITDPEQLAAAMLLEGYGKFVEQSIPEFSTLPDQGFTVVLAMEEMIAVQQRKAPSLFKAVKGWYDVDEGFSQELVNSLLNS